MGNLIGVSEEYPFSEGLKLNGIITIVFLIVLGLSGARLAKIAQEKHLIYWLLARDQSVYGLAM